MAGVITRDSWRWSRALTARDSSYLALCNHNERLESAPGNDNGYRCDWQWTSDLHAPKIIPALGRCLMRRALRQHPIGCLAAPLCTGTNNPQISFLIGHRGMARLPHLLATLKSIAGQQGAVGECIVVEQDTHSQIGPHLPPWVRLVHTPPLAPDMPYCRSWAFNVAAKQARSPILVLHDNDMLMPTDYAAQILHRVAHGYEVVNLKRFIFYLHEAHTDAFLRGTVSLLGAAPAVVLQNAEAGGSVAITRAGFDQIGGMDESFIGWGGEDNEFWERAQTLRAWTWGSLPMVHLWHVAQAGKQDPNANTAERYRELAQISPSERIESLRAAPRGLN